MKTRKALKALSPLVALAALSGCATAGIIYEDVGHPPLHVFPNGEGAGVGWDRNLNGSFGGRELVKKGVACSQDILKLVAWGDATQAAAAKQGGITEVVGLDFDNTAILGFIWTQSCTVVYGHAAPSAPAVEVEATIETAPAAPPPTAPAPEPVGPAPTVPVPTVPPAPAPPPVAPPAPATPPAPMN